MDYPTQKDQREFLRLARSTKQTNEQTLQLYNINIDYGCKNTGNKLNTIKF